jgi:hypothetical protein
MHSYANAREVNSFGTGNVLDHFKKMKNLISVNDGTRKFTPRTVTCHDQQAPFWENEQTYLSITHKDHHISHISDGFIHMIIEPTIQLTGVGTINDPKGLGKIFVGFKDSNQIFKQMWIRTRNQGTGYEQSEMIREGFAMGQSMDFNTKKSKKYTHTLYDNVSKYNESVCGTYVNLHQFRSGTPITIQIELIIPFDDLAALQAFAFYPNSVVGDLELSFYVGSGGLVWAPVDIGQVLDIKQVLQNEYNSTVLSAYPRDFSHQFAQINNPLTCFTSLNSTTETVTWASTNTRLICTSMRVISCEANMSGFQVRESTLRGIADIFSTPVNIPAEYLEYNAFPTPPDENGLRSTLNTMLSNVKDIYVMFPKRTNDVTCFDNPCVDQFCIRCLGVQYPEKVVSTLGARFYQYSLIASDLGAHLRPTTEFVDSYTQAKNADDALRTKYSNTLRDGSSFALIVQTERNESGYVFDGLDSEGQSTPIDIQFTPIVKGDNDTYYNFAGDGSHPPAPQLWLCRNVYWSVDIQHGLVFHKYGTPEGLEIDS